MNFVSDSRAQTVPRALLAVLRIYLGIVFLLAVWAKFGGDPTFGTRLPVILERMSEGAHGFYRSFLHTVVLRHVGVFAILIILAELVTAVSLIAGVATRLGSALAMFLVMNYMFMKGAWFWTPSSNDAAFFFIAVVLMVGAAGRSFGVDLHLSRKWPAVRLW